MQGEELSLTQCCLSDDFLWLLVGCKFSRCFISPCVRSPYRSILLSSLQSPQEVMWNSSVNSELVFAELSLRIRLSKFLSEIQFIYMLQYLTLHQCCVWWPQTVMSVSPMGYRSSCQVTPASKGRLSSSPRHLDYICLSPPLCPYIKQKLMCGITMMFYVEIFAKSKNWGCD